MKRTPEEWLEFAKAVNRAAKIEHDNFDDWVEMHHRTFVQILEAVRREALTDFAEHQRTLHRPGTARDVERFRDGEMES